MESTDRQVSEFIREFNRCTRKAKFSKARAAKRVADIRLMSGVTMRSYHCNDCGWWHLTKKAKR